MYRALSQPCVAFCFVSFHNVTAVKGKETFYLSNVLSSFSLQHPHMPKLAGSLPGCQKVVGKSSLMLRSLVLL